MSSSASRLWQAVTPEPHIATSGLPPAGCQDGLPALAQRLPRRESVPSVPRLRGERMIDRARHMTGDRIQRFVLAGKPVRGAGIDQGDGVAARGRPGLPPSPALP